MSLNEGENTCPKRNVYSIHIIIFPCVCQRLHFLLLFSPLKKEHKGMQLFLLHLDTLLSISFLVLIPVVVLLKCSSKAHLVRIT